MYKHSVEGGIIIILQEVEGTDIYCDRFLKYGGEHPIYL